MLFEASKEDWPRVQPVIFGTLFEGSLLKAQDALIEIDYSTVSEWARRNGVIYTGFTSLASHTAVIALIEGEIAAVNEQLSRVEQVKKFRIIPKELDPEEGDTTPTRKVKRKHLESMFAALISDMYGDEGEPAPIDVTEEPRRTKEKVEA